MGRKIYDWSEVQRYHDAGHNRDACMAQFGFGIAAWYKAIRRGKLQTSLQRTIIDWAAVQRHYNAGYTLRECRAEFRFSAGAWTKTVNRDVIKPRTQKWPLERILAESKSRVSIKRRLLEAGILKNECDQCGLSSWRGHHLSIQLDHRNGVRDDHRLENLRMLCPNCHSQTSTFGTRNRKQKGSQRRTKTLFPGGVIGNTSRSEREESRFETLPGSHSS